MNEKRPTVLVVDDSEGIRDTLQSILKKHFSVVTAEDGETALKILGEVEVNIVLLDIRLPGLDGLEVLQRIKEQYDYIDVVMVSMVKEVETVVRAMKLGAYDYIVKDFSYGEVVALIERIVDKQEKSKELLYLRSEIEQYIDDKFIVGKSQKMLEVYEVIQKVAKLPATILITGKSGTGKELVARIIHKQSDRAEKPFVTVNMASVPGELVESTLFGHEKGSFTGAYKQHYGKFELADGGTLFLDEIGDMKFNIQSKILRAIQEGEVERVGGSKTIPVDARLIAATNMDLSEAVRKGEFREDLYYRLNVIPIRLPSLQERIADLSQLAQFFIERYNKRFRKEIRGITEGALDLLRYYPWPGNIRELENLMERLVAMTSGELISEEDIPIEYHLSHLNPERDSQGSSLFENACRTFERNFILKVFERVDWSRSKAARVLGVPFSTLKYKMKTLNLYDSIERKRKKR